MNTTKKLIALRGACQSENNGEDMIRQVCTLYDELLNQNNLLEDDIVSVIFSVTPDLDEKNPAAALRQGGKAKDLALPFKIFLCLWVGFNATLSFSIKGEARMRAGPTSAWPRITTAPAVVHNTHEVIFIGNGKPEDSGASSDS